jgi:short-subunit dehydrogenase
VEIRNKVALITGASEGIGAACARSLARRGAKVCLTARSADKLNSVAADCGPDAHAVPGDLLEESDRRRIIDDAASHFGAIDILINNAGVGLYAPSLTAPLDKVRELFELNLFAGLAMIQLVAPQMRRRRSGTIVNVSSIAGKITLPWFTLYSVSKYAVCSLTDGIRMELAADGIHAMTVCPGYVDTGFQKHVIAGKPPSAIARGRRFSITAEECAEAIALGIERDARTVVTPRTGWLLIAFARLFPRLVDAQLARMNARYGGGA